MAPDAAAAGRFPTWVRNQRNSWHGVEYPYHSTLDVAEYYRRYMETLRAVDDSVGRVVEWLKKEGQLENTLIVYMGDNGFAFGEHGLIDKRTAFDWSMRVPMLVYAPGLVSPGQQIDRVVANIDIAPTLLDLAGREGTRAHAGHEHAAAPARRAARRGATRCSTSTTGSGAFRRRRRSSRCAANATSTSSRTASGTSTCSSTCRPTRRSRAT